MVVIAKMVIENMYKPVTFPFFSVVIPVYNKEPHIARSIQSILDQSFDNFELLIICDPSTDKSNFEVEKFSDSRIRVFYRNEPGPGGYAARNLGIEKAKAEWIAFLDADDEWYSDYLKTVHQTIIESNQSSFIASGWKTLDYNHTDTPTINSYFVNNSNKGIHTLNFKEYLAADVNMNRPFYTSTAVIKKSLLIESGLFPAGKCNRGGDIDTWLRCIFLSDNLTVNNYIGACYYRDSINMVTKTSFDNASAIRSTIDSILRRVDDEETVFLLKRFSNYYTKAAWLTNYNSNNYRGNFNLYKTLYYDVNTLNSLTLGFLSLLPEELWLKVNENKDKLKFIYNSKFFIKLIR